MSSDQPLDVAPSDVSGNLEWALIDVRAHDERTLDVGFIPGSRSFGAIYPGTLAKNIRTIYADQPVALICLSGRRTADLIPRIRAIGCTSVSSMEGGLLGWRGAGLPTVGDGEAPPIPNVSSAQELKDAIIGSLVAELVEFALDHNDEQSLHGLDPAPEVERIMGPALNEPLDRFALYEALDKLAEQARFRGHPLYRIANNLVMMRCAVDNLLGGPPPT